jgi:hypothetical protein
MHEVFLPWTWEYLSLGHVQYCMLVFTVNYGSPCFLCHTNHYLPLTMALPHCNHKTHWTCQLVCKALSLLVNIMIFHWDLKS